MSGSLLLLCVGPFYNETTDVISTLLLGPKSIVRETKGREREREMTTRPRGRLSPLLFVCLLLLFFTANALKEEEDNNNNNDNVGMEFEVENDSDVVKNEEDDGGANTDVVESYS